MPKVVATVLTRVSHAGTFTGANQLRAILKLTEQKIPPEQIKKLLFDSDWEYLKPIAGVQPRGGSDPKVDVSDEQCKQLSIDYPDLLEHWQKTARNRKKEKNWRAYAKVDRPDTPDDLLDRLDGDIPEHLEGGDYPSIPSALALEHAARRCRIPANEYSHSTLKNLRLRGDKAQDKSNDSIELSE